MKKLAFSTLLATTSALLLSLAPTARAQDDFQNYPGGVSVLTRDFDPTHPGQSIAKPVFGDPNLLRQVVNTAWQASRATISDQIIAQMGQANSIAAGVTPYNIVCVMGQPGALSVQPGSYAADSTLQMKYVVTGNSIEFDTTQPTALGKWADPRFSCNYDLTLNLGLTFGNAPGPLQLTSVTAQISNAKLDSHGLIADLVFVGNDVAKLFGSDYIKKAQNAINGKNFDFTDKLNQGLAPFNATLGQFGTLANSILNGAGNALPGGLSPRSLPGMTPQGPQLLLFMNRDGKIPTRGTGQISGAITWKKTIGKPGASFQPRRPIIGGKDVVAELFDPVSPMAGAFKIRAIAQSGFAREGTFVPPMTEVGVLKSVVLDSQAPADSTVLRYVIGDLPLNIPIKVETSLSDMAWQGDIGSQQRIVGPTNWTGLITLKPGRALALNAASVVNQKSSIGALLRGATPTNSGATAAPATTAKSRINIGGLVKSGTDKVALNPQPLPPGPDPDKVALNPQPLPPRVFSGTIRQGNIMGLKKPALGGVFNGQAVPNNAIVNDKVASIAVVLPLLKRDNPSGQLAVGDINFEVGLITGPR